jgi:signal transduction histidine kinase
MLVAAVLVPAGGLITWYIIDDWHEARDAAYAKVKFVADGTAGNLEDLLRDNEAVLSRLAERPLVRALDPTQCDPILTLYLKARPEYSTLALRDANANLVCTLISDPPPAKAVSGSAWFKRALRSGAFTVSDATQRPSPSAWVSIWAFPVRDAKHSVSGFVFFSVDLLKLNRHMFQSLPRNALVEVTDGNDRFLLRSSEPEQWIGKAVPEPIAGREGYFSRQSVDKVRRLYAFVSVPGTDWRVFAGLPEDEVLADSRGKLMRGIAVGGAALLLVLALAYRVSSAIVDPIRKLVRVSARIAGGDKTARALIAGPPELELVARQFNFMLDVRDSAEKAALDYANRLRAMSQRIVEVQESNQRSLARELHDNVSSSLAVVGLELHAVEKELSAESAAKVGSRLADCIELVQGIMENARDISSDMHCAMLDYAGLAPALEDLGNKLARRARLAVELRAPGEAQRAPPQTEIALYRIAQEALTNCVKHAHATRARIELAYETERISLAIADDGQGFDPIALAQGGSHLGLGLLSMRERAEAIGGELLVASTPGQGTNITVRVPRRAAAEQPPDNRLQVPAA